MRASLTLLGLALLLTLPLHAETFDVTASLAGLTPQQRTWLETFEAGARLHAATDLPAAEWLSSTTLGARQANLHALADYLDVAADVLRGRAPVEEMEKAFRRTLDEPLYVMLRVVEGRLADVAVALPRKAPEELSRVATLHFRAGLGASSASPASYLPFDRAMNPQVGRTWIVYDNMLPAGWFATRVKPAAEKVLPSLASKVTADAHLRWYALRPPQYDGGRPLSRADLEKFGEDRDALRILKADVFCTLAAGATEEDLATLLALSLLTYQEALAGDAPPPHQAASAMLINTAIERGAVRFRRDVWTADLDRFVDVVRAIANELLTIEAQLDVARAHTMVMKYGHATKELDRTAALISALPKQTIQPRYAISPAGVVLSFLQAPSLVTAVAHLDTPDKDRLAEMLAWDFALDPEHRIDTLNVNGELVTVQYHETNDFARLLGFPGWDATSRFTIRNGLIASMTYEPAPNQPEWKPYLEKALPWLNEHFPQTMARLYVNGTIVQTPEAAKEWVEMLRAWRNAP
ncbi:MAG TPA: hypothetical protein VHW00_15780 [Thermoanaerobaculia bacterium]|nr:hypothetical protein [Thermoanaerobaculia bacterium]